MKILDFLRSKVLRNTFWLILGRVYNKGLSFVVGIFCARYLGPGGYGLIDYAGAYISLFAAICNLGLNTVLVKDFVDTPENAGKTLGTTFVLRGISSLLSVCAPSASCFRSSIPFPSGSRPVCNPNSMYWLILSPTP